jgi:deoxyribonuclease IV
MLLGAHLGIAGGIAEAAHEADRLACESLQIFSKSPQMWSGPPLLPEAAEKFRDAVRTSGLKATAVHHGYLLNLASPKPPMLQQSRRAFADEIGRANLLGVDALIFHTGAHLGSGIEPALRTLAESLRLALEADPDGRVRLLLENAAGQGTTLGSNLEELAGVLDTVGRPDRTGVTLDTCHLFAAGFDFRTPELYGGLIDRIEATIGVRRVYAFHLNDAKAPLGSHLDRHENIGRGTIGEAGFRELVRDRRWAQVPGYLETPLDDRDYARYAEDLATLRGLLGASTARRGRKRPTARAPPANHQIARPSSARRR